MTHKNQIQQLREFPVTCLLLLSFVILFVIQVLTGVSAESPSMTDLLKWGANNLWYSASDEPWRLVSAGFLHIGIMHLLFNGFAMYYFGQVAEMILGKIRFLLLFLAAVIGGNLLNCAYAIYQFMGDKTLPNISAGASGGIMGIGALLLTVAISRKPIAGIQLNVSSLLMVMIFNLTYGFVVPGIDNAGHIGGAIVGMLLGLVVVFGCKKIQSTQIMMFLSSVIMLCILFFFIWNSINTDLLLLISNYSQLKPE